MSALDDAISAARNGQLIVMPTDTVYGIGTAPIDPLATARLFEAKGRPLNLELPVLVGSRADAQKVAAFDERARVLAEVFWPGALTLVLPRAEVSRGWDLGGDAATVAIRVPHHPLALAVVTATGPMAVTSANPSGVPPLRTCEELVGVFGDSVAVYLCEDEPLAGRASTIVDIAHGELMVLREGEVTEEDIRRSLA